MFIKEIKDSKISSSANCSISIDPVFSCLSSTEVGSSVGGHGGVDPLPVVGDGPVHAVGPLASVSVAHVTDEDVTTIDLGGQRTTAVTLLVTF